MNEWRPDKWVKDRNIYMEREQPKPPHYKIRQNDYEAGADAMLTSLLKISNGKRMRFDKTDSGGILIYVDSE